MTTPPRGAAETLHVRAEAAISALSRVLRIVVAFLAGAILVATAGTVLDRHLLKSNFDAFDQYARLALVWMTFLGFALALRERQTIRIEILDGFLGRAGRLMRATIFDLAMIWLCGLLVVKGLAVTEVGSFQDIIGTPFTYAWSYAAVPVCGALMGLFLVLRIFGRLLGREPEDGPSGHT